ncbi:uncharacterized protein G2W53_010092 [Senna tora]|uniref:Uncharacterized protein n=1 Tax=Senna tora TaxID=362788 RepID=A0A834WZH9_9FABA|nr:uncharacterized protein G2W53_010092 [Senna tora]
MGSLLEYLLKSPFFTPIHLRMFFAVRSTLFPLSIQRSTAPSSSEKTRLDSGSLAKNSKFTSREAQMPLDLKSDSNRSLAKLSRKSLGLLVIADEVSDSFFFTIAVEAIVFVREVKRISEVERERDDDAWMKGWSYLLGFLLLKVSGCLNWREVRQRDWGKRQRSWEREEE